MRRIAASSLLLLAGCFGDVELQKPHDPPEWPMGQPRPNQGDERRRAEQDVSPAATPDAPPPAEESTAPLEAPPTEKPPVTPTPAPTEKPPVPQ